MSQVSSEKISVCRICSSVSLKEVLKLNKMPFTDEFVFNDTLGKEYLGDIQIGICGDCGSVQNLNDTDMFDYYNDYTYSVQASGFAMNFMSTLAQRTKENYYANNPHPKVIEIGSGSGEQLLEFQKLGFKVLGIEPSDKLSEYANSIGVKTLTAFFDEHTKNIVDPEFAEIDVVISSYTFDHIPRPVEVLQNIHRILSPNGLIILEVHNLDLIKERNEFCLFEHEHYTYLNEKTLESLVNRNGFELVTFELLTNKEKRANSLLIVARKVAVVTSPVQVDVEYEVREIQSLSTNIYQSIANLENWLEANKEKSIVAYGAGGRGIMTIAALKNPGRIQFIVDKNPKAPSIFAPKSHLPVMKIEVLKEQRADKIIVFSFGYYNEIVQELSVFGYREDQFISILDILRNV